MDFPFSSIVRNMNLCMCMWKEKVDVLNLVDDEFVMVEKINIKANDLKRIKEVIADNKDIIINRWNEYFK